jgi:hypothetical protein
MRQEIAARRSKLQPLKWTHRSGKGDTEQVSILAYHIRVDKYQIRAIPNHSAPALFSESKREDRFDVSEAAQAET